MAEKCISIENLYGKEQYFSLQEILTATTLTYPDNDVIYIDEMPCKLSSAKIHEVRE